MKASASVVFLVIAGFPTLASAQVPISGFALQLFDPSYAGDRFLGLPNAGVRGNGQFNAKLTLNYGHEPLRVVDDSTGDVLPNGVLVRNQLYLHADFSYTLADRIKIGLGLPFAAVQSGDSGAYTGNIKSARLADARIGARADIFGNAESPLALAAQLDFWLPTGSESSFASDGTVRAHPRAIVSGLLSQRYIYSATVGANIRPNHSVGFRDVGSSMTYSGGIAMLLLDERLWVGPEVYGGTNFTKRQSPLEAIVGAHLCAMPSVVVSAGVGTGFTDAPGTTRFRALASVGYEPERCTHPPMDTDNDGIVDNADACPRVPGVASDDPAQNGCPAPVPPPDRDQDGIADANDACPDVAGVASDDPEKNGCPLPQDKDKDGIIDAKDACPNVAGVASDDPEKNGCPPPPQDRDGDGIPDKDDACPDKPGVKSDDPQKNGCPVLAQLTATEITINEQILFKTNSAEIEPASEDILRAVATILTEHTDLKISVEGHTDNHGIRANNQVLSARRAQAVRNWLVKAGIDAARVTSKGFGQDVPIDTNSTEEGRQKNRRVVFRVVSTSTEKPGK